MAQDKNLLTVIFWHKILLNWYITSSDLFIYVFFKHSHINMW